MHSWKVDTIFARPNKEQNLNGAKGYDQLGH